MLYLGGLDNQNVIQVDYDPFAFCQDLLRQPLEYFQTTGNTERQAGEPEESQRSGDNNVFPRVRMNLQL